MDRTPPQSKDRLRLSNQRQSEPLLSEDLSNGKGNERKVVSPGVEPRTEQSNIRGRRGGCKWCRGSVAEHWRLKPEALGSTPGDFDYTFSIGLRTVEESHQSDSSSYD